MYSAPFDYFRANTVAEAVGLLRAHPGAKLLAGGHSLLPQMKLRVATPPALIDIGRLAELRGIRADGDALVIGALTTHDMLATSPLVAEHCPILAGAAGQIGDQQVRNRGTIGGSLAHADPASDLPTVMVALGGTLTVMGPDGERRIPADEAFIDLFTTAIGEGEVLTEIRVPAYGTAAGGAYVKHQHPASGYAVVGAAAMVMASGGNCTGARLAIGGATPNPVRAAAAEAALVGQPLNADTIAAAGAAVAEALPEPMGDHYASADYRRHLATVLARQALAQAAARIG
jgi:carbon-monoxide dehydrogenase medium subunit